MSTLSLLYEREYRINDHIRVLIPTVGEILRNEDAYYSAVHLMTAKPIDLMVELDDAGVDFTTISDWELFILLFPVIARTDTRLILSGLDLSNFVLKTNEKNGQTLFVDERSGAVIDMAIHAKIAATLRRLHHLEANRRRPANEEAKRYMLERARVKAKRNKNRAVESELESLIVAMVNTEQYKYNFESPLGLSIFQFNESVRQIIKKIDYDNRMYGVYAGTINPKELSRDDLNWLVRK